MSYCDYFIKFFIGHAFTNKTVLELFVTVLAIAFIIITTPLCLMAGAIGIVTCGLERWFEIVTRFNAHPFIVGMVRLVLPIPMAVLVDDDFDFDSLEIL